MRVLGGCGRFVWVFFLPFSSAFVMGRNKTGIDLAIARYLGLRWGKDVLLMGYFGIVL